MKINVYTVDFETPRWLRKAIAYVMPLALVCGVGVAYAKVQHTFQAGEVLKAADLNANFDALALGPIYCGATDSTTGDLSGLTAVGTGYAKARAACQSACMSSTAHMCMGAEVIQSAQHGIAMPNGWYSPGAYVEANAGVSYECSGFTHGTAAQTGPMWNTSYPSLNFCDVSYPVMCCD